MAMISKAIVLINNDDNHPAAPYCKWLRHCISVDLKVSANQCYIRKLPTELLYGILLYVAKEEEFSTTHLLLSRVCSHWKNIVYSSPRFWSDLVIRKKHTSKIVPL